MVRLLNYLLAILIVLTSILSATCATGNDKHESTNNDKAPIPNSLKHAQNLDKEGASSGKISLYSRDIEIETIIQSYESALPNLSGEAVQKVNLRIEELKFERHLIEVIEETLESLTHLSEAQTNAVTTDSKWIQSQIRDVYVEAEFLDPQIQNIEDVFQRLFDTSFPAMPNLVSEPNNPQSDTNAWISVALHFDPVNAPNWFQEYVLEADNLPGILLTHQFLALLIQQHSWPEAHFGPDRENRMRELAESIASEENIDTQFTDLFAERVAMLIAGGYSHLAKKEWLEQILDNRLTNSLWPLFAGDETPHMHTSHVSLWALAGYQIILQRGEQGRKNTFLFKPSN